MSKLKIYLGWSQSKPFLILFVNKISFGRCQKMALIVSEFTSYLRTQANYRSRFAVVIADDPQSTCRHAVAEGEEPKRNNDSNKRGVHTMRIPH